MSDKMIAICSSIIGSVRKHNEDNFYFARKERCFEEEKEDKIENQRSRYANLCLKSMIYS